METVGVVAVILSLLFVGYELILSSGIARSEKRNYSSDLNRSISELIVENADVWARGCTADELTPVEAIVFTNMVQAVIHFQFEQYQQGVSEFSNMPTR